MFNRWRPRAMRVGWRWRDSAFHLDEAKAIADQLRQGPAG
jgi:hypothetical protein